MTHNDPKQLLEDSCRQLASILEECQNGPKEAVLAAQVMEPMLQEITFLKDQLQADLEALESTKSDN